MALKAALASSWRNSTASRAKPKRKATAPLADLRNRFQYVSGELSREFETLSNRLSTASDRNPHARRRSGNTLAREQARIREEAAHLPASARETAEIHAPCPARSIARHRTADADFPARQRAARHRQARNRRPARPAGSPHLTLAQQESAPSRGKGASHRKAVKAGRWVIYWPAPRTKTKRKQRPREAPPAAGPVRLDVATIARALDPATASAIWSRIRAGQRNVLVRSIYAPEARTLFDQIAARMRTDAELEQSIFRYLNDFERIIKDAEGRDTSGHTAQSHLVSDTGRVYLFLAHAAGRIR